MVSSYAGLRLTKLLPNRVGSEAKWCCPPRKASSTVCFFVPTTWKYVPDLIKLVWQQHKWVSSAAVVFGLQLLSPGCINVNFSYKAHFSPAHSADKIKRKQFKNVEKINYADEIQRYNLQTKDNLSQMRFSTRVVIRNRVFEIAPGVEQTTGPDPSTELQ